MNKIYFFSSACKTSLALITLIIIGSVLFISQSAGALRSTLSPVCRYGVSVSDYGTLPNGNRYMSFEYSVKGNDYARRFSAFSVVTEPGHEVRSNTDCSANNVYSSFYWDGNSINANNQFYRTLYSSTFGSSYSPVNVYLGNANPIGSYTPQENYCNVGIGGYDDGSRALFGVHPVRGGSCQLDRTTFASINDGGIAYVNDTTGLWCVGMDYGQFSSPVCSNPNDNSSINNRDDSATQYNYGADFAGYLQSRNANAVANVASSVRTNLTNRTPINSFVGFNPSANDYSFLFKMAAQNTRDPVPPSHLNQCTNVPPNTSPCTGTGLPDNPLINNNASTIFTFELTPDAVDVCTNLSGVQSGIPPGYSRSGSSCVFVPPTCTVLSGINTPIGTSRDFTIRINNNATANGGFTMNVDNVSYSGFGSAGNAGPLQSIPAGSSREFTSGNIGPITVSGSVSWSISYDTSVENNISTNLGDCVNVNVTTEPPQCTADSSVYYVGDEVRVQLSINNINNAVMNVNSVRITVTPGGPTNQTVTGGPASIAANDRGLYEFVLPSPVSAGQYIASWSAVTAFGNCSDSEPFTVANKPYTRFFGADVFAGGGYGNSCATSGNGDALGYVQQEGSLVGAYKGTGAQLAVFARGVINGVKPRVQWTSDNPQTLAFGNSLSLPPVFGGNYGVNACADEHTVDSDTSALPSTNLSTISMNGDYTVGVNETSLTTLNTGASGIANGRDITVHVTGNVRIVGFGNHFGYANTAWNSIEDIPSLRIIATGNIYIDHQVNSLDGFFVSKGDRAIYTCSVGDSDRLNLLDSESDKQTLVDNCGSNLTVHGAFVARKVHLLRSLGNVNDSVANEGPDVSRQAETFIYSPEMYLQKIGLSSDDYVQNIDSIVSLPPSF